MVTQGRWIAVALVAGLVGVAAAAADEGTQAIKAGALNFTIPQAWKKETPKSAMRLAQIKVDPVAGDDEPAEMTVFAFPGGAGTVESNIDRWEKGFVDADRKTPKAKVEKRQGMNVEVTRVDIAGRYVSAMMPGATARNDKPNFRQLGAIVENKDNGYFFKLVGPEKTIAAAARDFDKMIESMKLDK